MNTLPPDNSPSCNGGSESARAARDKSRAASSEEASRDDDVAALLRCLAGAGNDARLLHGNRIKPLRNGDRIFPEMLSAIDSARHEICFETFVYWSGDIAHRFADALAAAATRGVTVRVILDGVGSLQMSDTLLVKMRGAGVHIVQFNRLRWWNLRRLNCRTHRKILVIDRDLAFTGGVGIAAEWTGDARNPQEWHDVHYRLQGPLTTPIRDAFYANWPGCSGEYKGGGDNNDTRSGAGLPQKDGAEDTGVSAILSVSSPRGGNTNSYDAFRLAIDQARERLRLTTAYFVPDEDCRDRLCRAAQRGVEVCIMVPGPHLDHQVARFASRAHWHTLLEAGVKIYVYERTMLHAKSFLVDEHWLVIGSANFDNRSFKLNEELNLHVFDVGLVAWHAQLFEQNLRYCHAFTLEEWSRRGWNTRLREWFSDHLRYHL